MKTRRYSYFLPKEVLRAISTTHLTLIRDFGLCKIFSDSKLEESTIDKTLLDLTSSVIDEATTKSNVEISTDSSEYSSIVSFSTLFLFLLWLL